MSQSNSRNHARVSCCFAVLIAALAACDRRPDPRSFPRGTAWRCLRSTTNNAPAQCGRTLCEPQRTPPSLHIDFNPAALRDPAFAERMRQWELRRRSQPTTVCTIQETASCVTWSDERWSSHYRCFERLTDCDDYRTQLEQQRWLHSISVCAAIP